MRSTKVYQHIGAPRDRVYRALIDPASVAHWKVPDGMSCQIHEFDAREGGSLRISLTYHSSDRAGKTLAHTDTYRGRFLRLALNEEVVELDSFETADPTMQGEMRITIKLMDVPDGTELIAIHEGLPPGVALSDNELGWRMALEKLAVLVEAR